MPLVHTDKEKGKKKAWIVAVMIFMVAIAGALLLEPITALHRTAETETIFANIHINGVAVGGLTPAEAAQKLSDTFQPALDDQTIRFLQGETVVYTCRLKDFKAVYDFSALAAEAYQYGRRGTTLSRVKTLRTLSREPYYLQGVPQYRYDDKRVQEYLQAVSRQVYKAPVNALMRLTGGEWTDNGVTGGELTVTEGIAGQAPNMDLAAAQLRRMLAEQTGGDISLAFESLPPAYTAADFAPARSLIGSFTTTYTGAEDDPRNINIRTAAERIHNRVVYPGEIFSANKILGPSTPENGYTRAAVIVNGLPVDDFGGGICQVTSTLYNALLYAELPVVERVNHSVKVGYLDYGFDAAVAGDYFDLKFKNDTPHPLLVVSAMRQGKLTVALYGFEVHPADRHIAFVSERVETLPPAPEKIQTDSKMPTGQTVVLTESKEGSKYIVYKIIYAHGKAVGKEKINTSVYKPVQGVIAVGGA